MSTVIQVKRSSVQGKVPTTTDLSLGEFAINSYDGKLYIKKNVNGTESIVTLSELTSQQMLDSIKTVDGTGSGLDADLLDGLNSTQFLRSDTSTTFTSGAVSFSAGTSLLGDKRASFAGFTMPQNPEGKHISSPFFFNDIAYARLRGATVSVLIDATPFTTTSSIDAMLNANSDFFIYNTAGVTTVTITMTSIPKTLNYGAYMGITFGHPDWRARNIVQEYSRDNGATWTTLTNVTNQSEEFYLQFFDATATPVNALRWTLSNFFSSQLRVVSLFAYNYNSSGMEGLYVTRNGGPIYGGVTITGSAAFNLDVTGAARVTGGILALGPIGSEGGELQIQNPDGSASWFFDIATTNAARIWSQANNAVLQIGQLSGTGGNIRFSTEGTEKVRLIANGNFGIGTTTPIAKLDVVGDVRVNSSVSLSSEAITLATTTKTQIASFPVATFRSGKLIVQSYNSVTGEVQISELLVAHNGTTASATEYGVVFTGSLSFVTYDVDISSGNVRLMVTNTTANSTQYKVSETLMVA